MTKLTLIGTKRGFDGNPPPPSHRASASEGEAAVKLLEANGYHLTLKKSTGQYEGACPFHEDAGGKRDPNFYLDATSSMFYCHSARCGQRGNLQTLERHFGFDTNSHPGFMTREKRLQVYEASLGQTLRQPFYDHGLDDDTIERFRLGWDNEKQHYVIPYLEGRRPRVFRFYSPEGNGPNGTKYWWEEGSTARLFNVDDAVGDDEGRVFICEGEQKAMLLCQLGFAAVATPGAGTFKDDWYGHFNHARKIYICYDNDNPEHHVYNNCVQCPGECRGHNPGQEGAMKLLEAFDWRAHNVLLPLPNESARKTDVNEFFIRDGNTMADFAELALGEKKNKYRVQTLTEIFENPPEESEMLVEQGILPAKGRLLVTGAPKAGKSIWVQNLALSLSSGIPFLHMFDVAKPTRVLLLDREISRRALYERMEQLVRHRPGYRAAFDNLHVDHDIVFRLDRKGAYDILAELVEQNGSEVVVFDTAYKFLSGDVESSHSISKAFEVLDQLIAKTGVSVVLTHHHRKGQRRDGKDESPHPDQVVGSFLWTGWPNATVLLNFHNRRVEDPFNTVCYFTAFRDAAPPDPLMLNRSRESIAYTTIKAYDQGEDDYDPPAKATKPTTDIVANMLLRMCPIDEESFLHAAANKLGVRRDTVKPYFIDALQSEHFQKEGRAGIIHFKGDLVQEETWEQEHLDIPDSGSVA